MLLEPSHPYYWAADFVSRNTSISALALSYYKYIPQTVTDNRVHLSLSRAEFLSASFMEEIRKNCPEEMELAFHSKVELRSGEVRHIPMLDMATSAPAQLQKLKDFLGKETFDAISWFKSGRSFHGYCAALLSETNWVRMMGTLLLANQKDLKPIVDPRWIGHRLISGYSALRWTKNTDQYISRPTLLETSSKRTDKP